MSTPLLLLKRLTHYSYWQLACCAVGTALQWFVQAPAPSVWVAVGLVALLAVSLLWCKAMLLHGQKLVSQASQVDLLPRIEKAVILHLLGLTAVTAVCWFAVKLPLPMFPLLLLAWLPAYLYGFSLLAKLLLTLSGVCLALHVGCAFTGFYVPTLAFVKQPQWMALAAVVSCLPAWLQLWQFGRLALRFSKTHAQQVDYLQSIATTDALTGLVNRRQFDTRIASEMARAKRHKKELSLALFDIDNFKRINDYYGHPVGDRILHELGQMIAQNVRESDIAARYGGEEFALILPETRRLEAYELLERLRRLVEQHVFCLPDTPLSISVSIGLTQFEIYKHTSMEFIDEADKALYEAKHLGKNRVVISGMGKLKPSLLEQPSQARTASGKYQQKAMQRT
jgi:diguanylate cyclase (GGDEF)-like protein